jgi:hypothetical protein
LDPTRRQEARWLLGTFALFAMVSGHLLVINVVHSCLSFFVLVQ